jgi:hypothetical protein
MAGSSKKGSSKGPKSPKSPKSPTRTRSGKVTVSKMGPVELNIEESPKSTRKGKAAAAPETNFNNEDYNIRSPERTKLLTKIKGVINNAPVSPALWACCQLADMNCLQDIAGAPRRMILGYEGSLNLLVLQCGLLGLLSKSR